MMQVVIANRLRDGLVAFLAIDGGWAHFIEDARVAQTESEAEQMQTLADQAVADNEIVDPMLIDVERNGDGLRPIKLREAIRAQGPTIRLDLGKQAEG